MLNLLVAYPYMVKDVVEILKQNQEQIRFLLDSGAFTAWKAGKSIDVDDYCKFIETLPVTPWKYFTLDKIGDPEGSLKNYEIMLKRGFHPIPVFTRGEDPKMIDEYYKTSDVIGIGGLVGTPGNRGFVKGIMRIIGKRHCHWLGFTNKKFVQYYKPFSCDSSSLESSRRFALVELFNHQTGEWTKVGKKDFVKRPTSALLSLIRSYGTDPHLLGKTASWIGFSAISRRLSWRSHIRASRHYEKQFGTKYFLAPSLLQPSWMTELMANYREEAGL